MKRRILLCLALPLLAIATSSASADDGRTRAAAWTTERLDLRIPMRDGAALAADVFLPPEPGRYPVVLVQTPYDKNRFRALVLRPQEDAGPVARGAAADLSVVLDRAHYAWVVVDWRGFYGSRSALRGKPRRGLDGHDCVEWAAAQPWSNGRIGTWGGSALGKQQFQTAMEHPPHLVCCVPLIAALGQDYEAYFDGGVPLGAHLKTLDFLGFGVSEKVRKAPYPNQRIWRLAKRITYAPERIEVPCLFITGWWDNYPDLVIRTFEDVVRKGGPRARRHSRLLVGPWDHVSVGVAKQGDLAFDEAALESGRAAKAFLDLHLRGLPDEAGLLTPRIRYWQSGETRWKTATAWQALPRAARRLYLHADGRVLAAAPPAAGEADLTRVYRFDPHRPSPTLGGANLPPLPHGPRTQNALDDRTDVLAYATPPLDRPLPLNGNASLTCTLAANRVDCDLIARLCDVHPDGKAYLVADGAVRVKLRDGRPRSLVPMQPTSVTVRFPVTAYTFRRGHRLRIYLSSSNAPRYEPNTHTGANVWDPAQALPVAVTIHHDARWPATLEVPVAGD